MKFRTLLPNPITALLVIAMTAINCSKTVSKDEEESPSVEVTKEEPTAPTDPADPGESDAGGKNLVISEFFKTEMAPDQAVRKDDGQLLLLNAKGEVAVAGVTRSKIGFNPSLAGDLFFARYTVNKGWSTETVQVPIELPLPPPIAAIAPEPPPASTPRPMPLPRALAEVKGGRLLDSGKALVIGELEKTSFGDKYQLNLEETKGADRNIFMSIFGASEGGVTKSIRYGLTGQNTVVGTAPSRAPTNILVTGFTASGLRKTVAGGVVTETAVPSNYLAEFNDEGDIVRHFSWPVLLPAAGALPENVRGLASNATTAFVAFERGEKPTSVFVKGVRVSITSPEFIDLPEKPVCQAASQGAEMVRIASVNATEKEVVVAVEISNVRSPGVTFPCFEVFDITPLGQTLLSKHEIINLPSAPTVIGSLRANFVQTDRILLTRSRPNTDSHGKGVAVVTFLYQRPLVTGGYESNAWSLSRPKDWYGNSSVDGLERIVRAVVWAKGTAQEDVVWVLSNDVTRISKEPGVEDRESLVHLGTYTAITREAP